MYSSAISETSFHWIASKRGRTSLKPFKTKTHRKKVQKILIEKYHNKLLEVNNEILFISHM